MNQDAGKMQKPGGNTNDVIQIGVTIAIDFWYNEFRGDVEISPKILLRILSLLIGPGFVLRWFDT